MSKYSLIVEEALQRGFFRCRCPLECELNGYREACEERGEPVVGLCTARQGAVFGEYAHLPLAFALDHDLQHPVPPERYGIAYVLSAAQDNSVVLADERGVVGVQFAFDPGGRVLVEGHAADGAMVLALALRNRLVHLNEMLSFALARDAARYC